MTDVWFLALTEGYRSGVRSRDRCEYCRAPMADEWPYICEECGRESSIVDAIRRANFQGTLDLGSAASR
ncbi:MAG: hypothetical protein QOG65_3004 [Actinomycetota bacterium]|jgi:hypothetical protein|nr:hypothetical protein [Actinomycetota bacterium]MDQ1385625.1 hypothetical protein [Actinomycetota bacterium]